MTSDQLKHTLRDTLQQGLDEIVDNANDIARGELEAIASDVTEAAIAGDLDTVNECAAQVLLVGELQRILASNVAREKMQIVVKTAFNMAFKLAIAAI